MELDLGVSSLKGFLPAAPCQLLMSRTSKDMLLRMYHAFNAQFNSDFTLFLFTDCQVQRYFPGLHLDFQESILCASGLKS